MKKNIRKLVLVCMWIALSGCGRIHERHESLRGSSPAEGAASETSDFGTEVDGEEHSGATAGPAPATPSSVRLGIAIEDAIVPCDSVPFAYATVFTIDDSQPGRPGPPMASLVVTTSSPHLQGRIYPFRNPGFSEVRVPLAVSCGEGPDRLAPGTDVLVKIHASATLFSPQKPTAEAIVFLRGPAPSLPPCDLSSVTPASGPVTFASVDIARCIAQVEERTTRRLAYGLTPYRYSISEDRSRITVSLSPAIKYIASCGAGELDVMLLSGDYLVTFFENGFAAANCSTNLRMRGYSIAYHGCQNGIVPPPYSEANPNYFTHCTDIGSYWQTNARRN